MAKSPGVRKYFRRFRRVTSRVAWIAVGASVGAVIVGVIAGPDRVGYRALSVR